MDMYRKSFLKAQGIAEKIVRSDRNHLLASVPTGDVRIEERSFVPSVSKWSQLKGYRMKSDFGGTLQSLHEVVHKWIRSGNASGSCSVFVISETAGRVSVFYGAGESNGANVIFKNTIPECEITDSNWDGCLYPYNGILTGTVTSSGLADIVARTHIDNVYVACICVPTPDEDIQQRVLENESIIAYLNDYKTFQRVYGNASRRVEEVPVPVVVRAISTLKEENEFLLRNAGTGMVRGAVRFGAANRADYERLKSAIVSSVNHTHEVRQGFEPVRCFDVKGIHHNWKDCLTIPCVSDNDNRHYMISWQTIESVASFCIPPMNSYEGFYVRNYHVDEDTIDVFPLTGAVSAPSINIGKICHASRDAVIPYHAMLSHTFVCGSPNNGKTTTVKRILKELHDADIPFTVIEAAKKEYIGLLAEVPELRIYTPGTDGIRLVVNPLQPEEGVLIENQADAVVRAIVASHGGEHPIPEALDGLLKQTYEKAGWKYGTMAYYDVNHPFPTFADALKNVPEYIEKHAQYGPEVKKNLEAALTLRTEHLDTGALGGIVGQAFGLSAKEILETPSVIELADFSSSSTEFLMNILIFKIHSYLSRLPEEHFLKRVLVVEEAHNIFRRTLYEESGKALNNNYFERMLAEIRSSGTGMILSDQRPSIMSEAVMANTTVKIVHSMGASEDRELIGRAMGLTDFQTLKTQEFNPGECIIGIRGLYGVQHAEVEALQNHPVNNAACHICSSRFRCRKEAVRRMISGMDQEKVRYHLAKVQSNPYNVAQLASNIDGMLRDLNITAAESTRLCLLGEILAGGQLSFQDCRVITNSYSNYLRRGV